MLGEGQGRGSMLNEMIKGRLTEVMFEQRQKQSKRPNHTATWGKRITDSKCKDPGQIHFHGVWRRSRRLVSLE